jgi:hypothetical protein
MTALATLFTRELIVMAADSLELEVDNYENRRVVGTREARKLFLSQKTGTGISVSGYSSWADRSVQDILTDFMEAFGDGHHAQEGLAQGLCSYLNQHYPHLKSRFHLAGFDEREPYVAELLPDESGAWKALRMNVDPRGRLKGDVLLRCEWETCRYARANLPDLAHLSVSEAVNAVDRIYAFEINLVRTKKAPADVGGPVDILVLTPGWQGFHSVKDHEGALLV